MGPLGLKDDDLRIEANNLGEQGLLVVRESTAKTPLSLQFALASWLSPEVARNEGLIMSR